MAQSLAEDFDQLEVSGERQRALVEAQALYPLAVHRTVEAGRAAPVLDGKVVRGVGDEGRGAHVEIPGGDAETVGVGEVFRALVEGETRADDAGIAHEGLALDRE